MEHPDVYMSPVKETNYFTSDLVSLNGPGDKQAIVSELPRIRTGNGGFKETHAAIISALVDYCALFRAGRSYNIRGECSPSYLYYARYAAERIKQRIPKCKIIIFLRDPIERAFSNYKALLASGREHLSFEEALASTKQRMRKGWEHFWDYLGLGLYYEQVKYYLETFSEKQVGIWLYEDMVSAPSLVMQQVFRFIGARDNVYIEPRAYNVSPSKVSSVRLWVRRHKLATHTAKYFMPKLVRRHISEILDSWFSKEITLQQETRKWLLDFYKDDILKLHALLPRLRVTRWIEIQERRIHGN